MKHDAKSKGCRLDLSVTELEMMLALMRAGRGNAPFRISSRDIDALDAGLAAALAAQQRKVSDQRGAAALRRTRAAGPDKRWKRSLIVEGHNVSAERGDFVDVGTAEYTAWQSLDFLEAMNKAPTQADVRRDVWLVRVSTSDEQRAADDHRYFLGSEVTETNNPADIEPLARRIIEGQP